MPIDSFSASIHYIRPVRDYRQQYVSSWFRERKREKEREGDKHFQTALIILSYYLPARGRLYFEYLGNNIARKIFPFLEYLVKFYNLIWILKFDFYKDMQQLIKINLIIQSE